MLDKIKETAIKIKELLQTNDKRCQDLLDFIEWGILNLPEDFRNNFTSFSKSISGFFIYD